MSHTVKNWDPFSLPVEKPKFNASKEARVKAEHYQFKYMGISSHIDASGTQFVETAIISHNGRTFSHNNCRAYNGLVFCPYELHNRDFLLIPPSDVGKIIFTNNIRSLFYQKECIHSLPSALKLEDEREREKFLSVTNVKVKGVRAQELVPVLVRKLITEEKACAYCEKSKYKPEDCAFWLAAKLRLFMLTHETEMDQ